MPYITKKELQKIIKKAFIYGCVQGRAVEWTEEEDSIELVYLVSYNFITWDDYEKKHLKLISKQ